MEVKCYAPYRAQYISTIYTYSTSICSSLRLLAFLRIIAPHRLVGFVGVSSPSWQNLQVTSFSISIFIKGSLNLPTSTGTLSSFFQFMSTGPLCYNFRGVLKSVLSLVYLSYSGLSRFLMSPFWSVFLSLLGTSSIGVQFLLSDLIDLSLFFKKSQRNEALPMFIIVTEC